MTSSRQYWEILDRVSMFVLVLPFLMVQLIGPAAMPRIGPDGLEIVLCSNGDLLTGAIDANGNFHEGEETHFSQCYWAVGTAPMLQTAATQLPSAADIWVPAALVIADADSSTGFFTVRPPVRGPPLTI